MAKQVTSHLFCFSPSIICTFGTSVLCVSCRKQFEEPTELIFKTEALILSVSSHFLLRQSLNMSSYDTGVRQTSELMSSRSAGRPLLLRAPSLHPP